MIGSWKTEYGLEQVPICFGDDSGIGLTREAGWSPARSRHCSREQDHIYVTGAIWEGVVERWSGARRTACLAITVRPASDGKGIFLQLCAWILAFGQDFFVAYLGRYLLYKCFAWIVQRFFVRRSCPCAAMQCSILSSLAVMTLTKGFSLRFQRCKESIAHTFHSWLLVQWTAPLRQGSGASFRSLFIFQYHKYCKSQDK